MDFQANYLTIKPIFDLALFGVEDAEKLFNSSEKLAFSERFLSYQQDFLGNDDSDEHLILFETSFQYLSNLDRQGREEIVKVILDNQTLAETLTMLSMLNRGTLDPEQGTLNFLFDLRVFIEENKPNECMMLFFQQHFKNFERIRPTNYKNFEVEKSEYWNLISDYLKVQSDFF